MLSWDEVVLELEFCVCLKIWEACVLILLGKTEAKSYDAYSSRTILIAQTKRLIRKGCYSFVFGSIP